MPALLLVGPSGGEVGDCFDFIIDNGGVAQGGADHAESLGMQRRDQAVEPVEGYHSRWMVGHVSVPSPRR